MTVSRSALVLSMLLACHGFAGCGGDPPKPPVTAQGPAPAATTQRLSNEVPKSPTASAVRLSPDLAKACGIAEPDAYFAFDSANIRAAEAHVLDRVAGCFSTGPLKGRALKLIGHADPRGNSEYNMSLGQSRADGVASYVVAKGLEKGKAQASTRGEMDATGTDEPSWARDRRVDLLIGQ